jgi:hypothetical protein
LHLIDVYNHCLKIRWKKKSLIQKVEYSQTNSSLISFKFNFHQLCYQTKSSFIVCLWSELGIENISNNKSKKSKISTKCPNVRENILLIRKSVVHVYHLKQFNYWFRGFQYEKILTTNHRIVCWGIYMSSSLFWVSSWNHAKKKSLRN